MDEEGAEIDKMYVNLLAAVIRRARVDCGEFGLAQCLKTGDDDVQSARDFLDWCRKELVDG